MSPLKMVTYQQNHLDTVRFLRQQDAATIAELKQAEAAYHSALITLSQAENAYAQLEAHLTRLHQQPRETKDPNTPRIRRIEAELESLDAQLKRLEQRAPYAGRIIDVFAITGQSVGPGTPLMLLGRTDKPGVTAYLDPKYSKYSRKGRLASVKFPEGSRLAAIVKEDAKLVRRLPADIAAPIGSRDLMLLVQMEFSDAVAPHNAAEGLPVMVRFETLW